MIHVGTTHPMVNGITMALLHTRPTCEWRALLRSLVRLVSSTVAAVMVVLIQAINQCGPVAMSPTSSRLPIQGSGVLLTGGRAEGQKAMSVKARLICWMDSINHTEGSLKCRAMDEFPGVPGASRGQPTASQGLWCFERVPSLLPNPLDRDRGRRGRSCFELPPASPVHAAAAGSAASTDAQLGVTLKPVERAQTEATQNLQHSKSEPKLVSSSPSKRVGTFRERIGVSWDDAAIAAGGAVRGSDGRFLGY